MCFAIEAFDKAVNACSEFQFPFRRDVLCNRDALTSTNARLLGFNSLFVGMCFAILFSVDIDTSSLAAFQFPFRRDVLCNALGGAVRRWNF